MSFFVGQHLIDNWGSCLFKEYSSTEYSKVIYFVLRLSGEISPLEAVSGMNVWPTRAAIELQTE